MRSYVSASERDGEAACPFKQAVSESEGLLELHLDPIRRPEIQSVGVTSWIRGNLILGLGCKR